MKLRQLFAALCLCLVSITAFGQGNGKLQLHFMDVGQGDGAILISPLGVTGKIVIERGLEPLSCH